MCALGGHMWSPFLHTLQILGPIFTYRTDPMCVAFSLHVPGAKWWKNSEGGRRVGGWDRREKLHPNPEAVPVFLFPDLDVRPVLHPLVLTLASPLKTKHTPTLPT